LKEVVNAAVRAKALDPTLFIAAQMRRVTSVVITRVRACQILDGHGAPAVEVELHTNKAMHRASVGGAGAPEGATVGTAQDTEMRENLIRAIAHTMRVMNDKVLEVLVGLDPSNRHRSTRPSWTWTNRATRYHIMACLHSCLTCYNLILGMSHFVRQVFTC
jgi:enolase